MVTSPLLLKLSTLHSLTVNPQKRVQIDLYQISSFPLSKMSICTRFDVPLQNSPDYHFTLISSMKTLPLKQRLLMLLLMDFKYEILKLYRKEIGGKSSNEQIHMRIILYQLFHNFAHINILQI